MERMSQEAAVTFAIRTFAVLTICISGGRLVYLAVPPTTQSVSGPASTIAPTPETKPSQVPVDTPPVPSPPLSQVQTSSPPVNAGEEGRQGQREKVLKIIETTVNNRKEFLAAMKQTDDSEQFQFPYLARRLDEELGYGKSYKEATAEVLTSLIKDVLSRIENWPGKLPAKAKAAGLATVAAAGELEKL